MATNIESNRDYTSISRPYNQFLERSIPYTSPNEMANSTSDANNNQTTNTGTNSTPSNGSVETQPVNNPGSMGDVWIKNFIRSSNWKPKSIGFTIDGQTGYAEFTNVFISGHIQALTGTIGGFTITATSLYGGIIKTAATVGAGSTGVVMDTDGLRGYDSVLGNTFNLPTDGSAPTFASGVINSTVFEVDTSAVIRTSTTVGDGSASSDGILINDTGFYACEANQTLANANVKILVDGTATFAGTVTATAGAIGGFTIATTTISGGTNLVLDSTGEGIITTGTLRSAASGSRLQITAATQRFEGINANGDVVGAFNWSGTASTAAVMKLHPQNDARRALEIITDATYASGSESSANAITIDNKADSNTIDITDGGLIGLQIADCDTEAIKIKGVIGNSAIAITGASTNDATLNFDFTSSSYPIIELEQSGTATNSYGIKIVQGTAALKEGIFIDDNANSHLSESIYIDRDMNSSSLGWAMKIDSNNAGSGNSGGIDFSGMPDGANKGRIIAVPADNNDPTGGGGAATGRIAISVAGALRYIPYYT